MLSVVLGVQVFFLFSFSPRETQVSPAIPQRGVPMVQSKEAIVVNLYGKTCEHAQTQKITSQAFLILSTRLANRCTPKIRHRYSQAPPGAVAAQR